MKPEQVYEDLKDLAERLDITVSEQNFRTTGISVKSGLCRVKGQNRFIMDKHKSLRGKIEILVASLARMDTENFYVAPAIRELLEKHAPPDKAGEKEAGEAGEAGEERETDPMTERKSESSEERMTNDEHANDE